METQPNTVIISPIKTYFMRYVTKIIIGFALVFLAVLLQMLLLKAAM